MLLGKLDADVQRNEKKFSFIVDKVRYHVM